LLPLLITSAHHCGGDAVGIAWRRNHAQTFLLSCAIGLNLALLSIIPALQGRAPWR
jgi:NADH-quinone oxidoreductase subunit N